MYVCMYVCMYIYVRRVLVKIQRLQTLIITRHPSSPPVAKYDNLLPEKVNCFEYIYLIIAIPMHVYVCMYACMYVCMCKILIYVWLTIFKRFRW